MFQNAIVSKLFGNSAGSKKRPLENCFRKLDTKFGWPTTMEKCSNHVPNISLEAEAEATEADSILGWK